MPLAFWRKWGPRCNYPKEQINKNLSTQNGVGVSSEAAGLSLFPQQSLRLLLGPIAQDSSQHPSPREGYETRCRKTLLYPSKTPSHRCSHSWIGPIHPVSCLVFTLWHGNNYYHISFLERKTTSLPQATFQSWRSGGRDSDKAQQGRIVPRTTTTPRPGAIWIEHGWSSLASPLPPYPVPRASCPLPTLTQLSPLCRLMHAPQNFLITEG